jgi:hypothetical protein
MAAPTNAARVKKVLANFSGLSPAESPVDLWVHGLVTVTLSDGRKTTADIEESMLSPEILARMLLLQMHRAKQPPPSTLGDAEPVVYVVAADDPEGGLEIGRRQGCHRLG